MESHGWLTIAGSAADAAAGQLIRDVSEFQTPKVSLTTFWVLGMIFSVLSSVFGALSSVLIRSSHVLEEHLLQQQHSVAESERNDEDNPHRFSLNESSSRRSRSPPSSLKTDTPEAKRMATMDTAALCAAACSTLRSSPTCCCCSCQSPTSTTATLQEAVVEDSRSNPPPFLSLPEWWLCLVPSRVSVKQLWFIGMALASVVGPVLSAVSVATAPASLVIAMAPVGLVLNVLFARLLLAEHVTWSEYLGCALIAAGIGVVLRLASKHTAPLDELMDALLRPNGLRMLAGFAVSVAVAVACCVYCLHQQRRRQKIAPCDVLTPMMVNNASITTTATITGSTAHQAATQGLSGACKGRDGGEPSRIVTGMLLSVTAGIACGSTTLSTRTLFTALEALADGGSPVIAWSLAGCSFLALIIMAAVDLVLMAKSLAFAPAVVASPLRAAFSFLVGTAGSVLLLRETPRSPPLFAGAMVTSAIGIACLTIRSFRFDEMPKQSESARDEMCC